METVGDRVKQAANGLGGLNSLAKAIGMPRRTLGDQISGKYEVKLSFIVEVARATGYSVTWLATGKGEMFTDPSKVPTKASPLNEELMRRLAQIAIRVYDEKDVMLRGDDIGMEAAMLYNELAGKADNMADIDEVEALLPWIENRLHKRLSEVKENPANVKSKRA